VLLARWLATEPALMILDEPTRGIDVRAKQEIMDYVSTLCRKGMSILFISSELPEVLRVSDRMVVMRDRKACGEYLRGELDETSVLQRDRRGGRMNARVDPSVAKAQSAQALRTSRHRPAAASAAASRCRAAGAAADRRTPGAGLLPPRDQGRPPVRQPGRHPQPRRAADAGGARHDAGDRHARHRHFGRRRGGAVGHRGAMLVGGTMGNNGVPAGTTSRWGGPGGEPRRGAAVRRCGTACWWPASWLQPIVATLILMVAGRGLAQLLTDGQIVTVYYKPFFFLGSGYLAGLPFSLYRGGRRVCGAPCC
jgi:energy-coupling factor transporter ATP-binding protein EcfA2